MKNIGPEIGGLYRRQKVESLLTSQFWEHYELVYRKDVSTILFLVQLYEHYSDLEEVCVSDTSVIQVTDAWIGAKVLIADPQTQEPKWIEIGKFTRSLWTCAFEKVG